MKQILSRSHFERDFSSDNMVSHSDTDDINTMKEDEEYWNAYFEKQGQLV